MNLKKNILPFITFFSCFQIINGEDSFITIPNLIRFPYSDTEGPFMGLFLAISLPLDLPDYNVFFSYNMEANYDLPQNETEYMYPPLLSRRSLESKTKMWDRKYFYDILEFKMKSHGYPGIDCLLRTICETSLYSSEHTGVLGDILHILLTPSTSTDDNLLQAYGEAERYGKIKRNCNRYNKKCSISFLDVISKVEHYFVK